MERFSNVEYGGNISSGSHFEAFLISHCIVQAVFTTTLASYWSYCLRSMVGGNNMMTFSFLYICYTRSASKRRPKLQPGLRYQDPNRNFFEAALYIIGTVRYNWSATSLERNNVYWTTTTRLSQGKVSSCKRWYPPREIEMKMHLHLGTNRQKNKGRKSPRGSMIRIWDRWKIGFFILKAVEVLK